MRRQRVGQIAQELDIGHKTLNQHLHNAAVGKSTQQLRKIYAGFTLVELSIVLVIVGLLIGGILVGQSLIDNVRSARLLRTLQQIEIISELYKQRAKQLPGDDLYAQQKFGGTNCGTACNGDGDGLILGTSGVGNQEGVRFWHHLKLSGLLDGSGIEITVPVNFPGVYNGLTFLSSKYIPNFSNIEKNLSIVGFGDPRTLGAGYDTCKQALYVGKPEMNNSGTPAGLISTAGTNSLNSRYVRYVDKKLDDYLPYSGKIMARDITFSGCLNAGTKYRTTPINGYAMNDQECNIILCMEK